MNKKLEETVKEPKIDLVQVPPALHGNHSLTPRQIDLGSNINPANGLPYAQVHTPTKGGMISPPPSRNFR